MATEITSRVYAQGSFGLYRINPQTGERRGHVMRIWFAWRDGKRVGQFLTREEAREALRETAH